MDNQKKMVAAMSAVMTYLQEEEAAIQMQAAAAVPLPAPEPPPAAPASLWGASGRQSQMQLRNLMQLRAFNRL